LDQIGPPDWQRRRPLSKDQVAKNLNQYALNCQLDPARFTVQSLPESGPSMTNIAVHPDGRLLAMGLGRDIQLWDVAARQVVLSLKGNQNQLYRLAFSPDGRFLATSGMDGVLRLWQVEIP
jgi:WD40 repeat protein